MTNPLRQRNYSGLLLSTLMRFTIIFGAHLAHGYGYVRASEHLTGGKNDGTTQESEIRAFAAAKEISLKQVFKESAHELSEELGQRSAGRNLLQALRDGDAVIVATLDRLFRDAHDASATVQGFLKNNVRLFAVDLGLNVASAATVQILRCVITSELERHSVRIQAGKKKSRLEGSFSGGERPFGFDVVDGRLVENQKEQRSISRAIGLRTSKPPMSYRNIAIRLSSRGDTTVSHVTVRRFLRDRGCE
jgi:putative DNA-invertase from lambdoid prophage Rac